MAFDIVRENKFCLGLVQMASTDDPADNLLRATEHVKNAARSGAQVICLPELFRSRYFCQREDTSYFDLAEPLPGGPTTVALSQVAREEGVVVVASVFERRAPGLYHNSVAIIDG